MSSSDTNSENSLMSELREEITHRLNTAPVDVTIDNDGVCKVGSLCVAVDPSTGIITYTAGAKSNSAVDTLVRHNVFEKNETNTALIINTDLIRESSILSAAFLEIQSHEMSKEAFNADHLAVICNAVTLGLTQACSIGLVWGGVTYGLSDNVFPEETRSVFQKALIQVIAGIIFGILRPYIALLFEKIQLILTGIQIFDDERLRSSGKSRPRDIIIIEFLKSLAENEGLGSIFLGLSLSAVFASIDGRKTTNKVARLTTGIGVGFFLWDSVRQYARNLICNKAATIKRVAKQEGAIKTLKILILNDIKQKGTFEDIFGNHLALTLVTIIFPSFERPLQKKLLKEFGVQAISDLSRFQAAMNIFVINAVFILWAERFTWAMKKYAQSAQNEINRRRDEHDCVNRDNIESNIARPNNRRPNNRRSSNRSSGSR